MSKRTGAISIVMFLLLAVGFDKSYKYMAQQGCEVGVLASVAQMRPDLYMKLDDMGAVDNFVNTYCKDVLRFE